MEYITGQAVMVIFNLETQMVFLYQETIGEYVKTIGLINPNDSATVLTVSTRPATEAEILEHIQKHGWKLERLNSYITKQGAFILSKEKVWIWENAYDPYQYELKEYCEEGLIAHRLITALNLAKQ